MGISVVNALSESTEVTVWRGAAEFSQAFERGDTRWRNHDSNGSAVRARKKTDARAVQAGSRDIFKESASSTRTSS